MRENIEMGREGQCTHHNMDTDMTREHLHLGQQVLAPDSQARLLEGDDSRAGLKLPPGNNSSSLNKYRTLVSSHPGRTSSHPSGAPSGSPLPFNSLR